MALEAGLTDSAPSLMRLEEHTNQILRSVSTNELLAMMGDPGASSTLSVEDDAAET